jgi:hypothetical protein
MRRITCAAMAKKCAVLPVNVSADRRGSGQLPARMRELYSCHGDQMIGGKL